MFGPGYGNNRRHRPVLGGTPTPGPVQSAVIEADGSVLALMLTGVSSGSWASYGITSAADLMAGVDLATTTAGFDRGGGQAVANASRARPLTALRPCRKTPIVPTSTTTPNANLLDEVDHGNGTRTVRLRLSRFVYAGDTCTLALGAGWRSGAPAQTGIAVANGSTLAAAPVVGGRWLTPPLQRVTGPFRVDVMAGSVNPEGRSGLAAVEFTVTDGTTTKTVWVDGLSTSTAQGDSLRCWGAEIDPSGLNPGLITVHKTLYPWIGPARTSGSGQGAASASFAESADIPLMMAYDPAGTRYPTAWVVCDPVNGTSTASVAMIKATLADAKAVLPASKPAGVNTALQALYLANRSAAAANGGAALTRMADNARIVLPAGTTSIGGASVTTGLTSTECWPIVIGDPDDPDPGANCVLEAAAATPTQRISRLALQDLTVRAGGVNLGSMGSWWLHNVMVEAKSGQEASSAFLTSGAGYIYATKCAIGTSSSVFSFTSNGAGQRFALARSCTSPRSISAQAIVGCNRTGSGWSTIATTAEGSADWISVGNTSYGGTSAMTWPMFSNRCVRPLFVNNLMERSGTGPEPIWAMGENKAEAFEHAVIENVTAVGDRSNTLYNDPPNLSAHNVHVDCRVANCYFDWLPTKHDDFYDDTTVASNGAAPNHGYRPWLIDGLWFQDGTNCECNVLGRRISANFEQMGFGLGAVVNPTVGGGQGNGWIKFMVDRSKIGDAGGNGDYRPGSGSPMIGVAVTANFDVDMLGRERGAAFASGALEAA